MAIFSPRKGLSHLVGAYASHTHPSNDYPSDERSCSGSDHHASDDASDSDDDVVNNANDVIDITNDTIDNTNDEEVNEVRSNKETDSWTSTTNGSDGGEVNVQPTGPVAGVGNEFEDTVKINIERRL
ncbi:hypothetical protein EVJ58_g5411 [Rhodofomes roseus]|uniref:Uncharacterized protein n=1 Tax=Rhodofomes roseus TaxID=34475 RepID=A0A4Y9YDQ8_9APHY|nr:hypothetical protein EVJ58_g5411 [Rhodofomes roseus]